MNAITTFLAWLEDHPALMQVSGIIVGATIALCAAKLAYKGIKEQIAVVLKEGKISRAHEQITIYRALAADLDALKKSLDGFRDTLIDDTATEGRGICKSVFLSSRNIVWESCAPKIGLLDPNHAANIIETYRFIDALTGRVRELNMENGQHRIDIAGFIEKTTKQIDIVLDGLPFRPDKEILG